MTVARMQECIWEEPSFTLDMLLDYLSDRGFDTVKRSAGLIKFSDAVLLSDYISGLREDEKDASLCFSRGCLIVFDAARQEDVLVAALRRIREMGQPVLGIVSEDCSVDSLKEVFKNCGLAFCLVSSNRVSMTDYVPVFDLMQKVLRFLLSERSFVDCLSVAAGEEGSFQALVDIAERRFGCFANITDAHYRLLAHTRNCQPDDEINKSLIDLGYHCEAHLRRQHTMGYLLESVANQLDVKIWPPDDTFPYYLLTGTMRASGQYAGHVLVAHPGLPRQGEVDEFRIFLSYCRKFARRLLDCLPLKQSPKQAFILQLASSKDVDGAFAREQAELLGLPATATFVLAQLMCNDSFRGQVGHIAEDLDSRLTVDHVTFICEGRASVLLFASSSKLVQEALFAAGKMEYGSAQVTFLVSDPFYRLTGTYYAAREIDVIVRHEREIMLDLRVMESGKGRSLLNGRTRRLSFRDAFAFFWRSSHDDRGFTSFVLSHLLVTLIADGDKGSGPDGSSSNIEGVALLFVYLQNERKATLVGRMCGLHRNGVLYRIEKMEKEYDIDLDDALTREYLLASIHAKIASSCDFRERFDHALSRLLGEL